MKPRALSFIFMNLIFMPMFVQGLEGMSRRMYDGGASYAESGGVVGLGRQIVGLNVPISHAAFALGLAQVLIINFFYSIKRGRKTTSDNPWEATTLDWQTPTPPPHGNFDKPMEVFAASYEYSVPGHAAS